MTQKKKGLPALFSRLRAYAGTPSALRLLIWCVTTVLCACLFCLAISPVRYDLRVGMVPNVTIAATKDVVDQAATEKSRAAAAAAVSPTYMYQEGVSETVLQSLEQVFSQLKAVRQYGDTLPDMSENRVFTPDELAYAQSMLTLISLRDYQITTLLHTSVEDLDALYSSMYTVTQNTMNGHVTQGQESAAVQSILQIIGFRVNPSLLQNIALPVLNACVQANMVVDQESTDAAREQAKESVDPVIYKQGQNIVVKGEGRITQGQIEMLSALGLLSHEGVDVNMYLGGALLVALVMLCMLLVLHHKQFEVYGDTVKTLLTGIVFVLTLALCVLCRLINPYFMPVALAALLLTALCGVNTALVAGVALSLLASSISAGGNEAYVEQMVLSGVSGISACVIAACMMNGHSSRLRALLTGLAMCASSFLVVWAYGLMTSSEISGILPYAFWITGGTAVGTVLFLALQPLFETAFNLPTPLKLLELSNPNQPLLRRLLLEAPGTYHHSIIVANLAEASAEAIGANPLLARVGGYYHDVGKLKRPLYFKENQMNDANAHDHTDPQVSAAIVTAHVRDGVAMARQYRLPQAVVSIIAEHHGDTPVMYFYHKALQQANGRPVNIDDFRYDGHPPRTKEAAIVMLCDTIEAAVRTMKTPTPEDIENFIVKLVRGKLEDGQLSDSPLTLQDIDRICSACTTVLVGVFHERIEYPDMPAAQRTHVPSEAEKEQEQAAELQQEEDGAPPLIVPEPTPEPVHVVEPEKISVAEPEPEPEKTGALPLVAPPPAAAPVPIDDLLSLQEMGDASLPVDEAMLPDALLKKTDASAEKDGDTL